MPRLELEGGEKERYGPELALDKNKQFTAIDANRITVAVNGIDDDLSGLGARVEGLTTKVDDREQEILEVKRTVEHIVTKVGGLVPQAPVIFYFNKSIEEGGIYIYTGVDEKTATIEDNIDGIVEFRNVGTGLLKLKGTFAPGFSEELYPRSKAIRLIWANGYYTY